MPLRDHFRPPVSKKSPRGKVPRPVAHDDCPAVTQAAPAGFRCRAACSPGNPAGDRLGGTRECRRASSRGSSGSGTAARRLQSGPPLFQRLRSRRNRPTSYEYEVRIYDAERGRHLVAAIEIVSPANKDRPEHRDAFVGKCAALLAKRRRRQHRRSCDTFGTSICMPMCWLFWATTTRR